MRQISKTKRPAVLKTMTLRFRLRRMSVCLSMCGQEAVWMELISVLLHFRTQCLFFLGTMLLWRLYNGKVLLNTDCWPVDLFQILEHHTVLHPTTRWQWRAGAKLIVRQDRWTQWQGKWAYLAFVAENKPPIFMPNCVTVLTHWKKCSEVYHNLVINS